jgi:hypothetical protein
MYVEKIWSSPTGRMPHSMQYFCLEDSHPYLTFSNCKTIGNVSKRTLLIAIFTKDSSPSQILLLESVLFELLNRSPKLVRFLFLVSWHCSAFRIWYGNQEFPVFYSPRALVTIEKEYLDENPRSFTPSSILHIQTLHAEFFYVIGTNQLFTVTSTTDFTPPAPLSKSSLKLVFNVNIVYGKLKSENSQDYAQENQRNCTFMNSAFLDEFCVQCLQ